MTESGVLDRLAHRLAFLEAESAVRKLVSEYFRICDDLGPDTSLEQLGLLFAADAVWEGQGRYREALGRHVGRSAIVAMLGRYAVPPHFRLNGHYLASESINVKSAESASGRWMMLQVSTYRDGLSDFRSAALSIDCRIEDGEWRIARFNTRHIFSRDAAPWNDDTAISVPQTAAKEAL